VVLGNASAEVTLDCNSGRMAELVVKHNDFGRWNQVPGWTEIVDELAEKTFRDGRSAASLEVGVVDSEDGPAARVVKRFEGAAFTVTEEWRATETEIVWSVQVTLAPGESARSLQIRQFVPWPESPYGWQLWAPQQHYPKLTAHAGNHRIVYGDICFGMCVPIASVYREDKDAGLSLAKPFGLKIPQWGFQFDTYHFGGVHVESMLVGLRPERDAQVAVMLRGHAGCWRPGLGWLVDKYPDYFRPGAPATPDRIEGGFMGGSPFSTPEDCELALRCGAKVVEVHLHFPHYGDYYPDRPGWRTIQWLEQPEEAKAKDLPENSVGRMNDVLGMFQAKGILPLPYIQLAGDGWRSWAEERFPESIAVSRDGSKIPVWKDCWMMNSDPSLPFGKHISEQIDRFFERHGELAAGIFWDQPCYDAIDVAHDDGVTMVDNKPAYRLVFCYEQHAEKMVAELRRRGQFLYANGPVYVELCRGIDAIMAEGVSWTADVVQYLCAARPMCFYSYFGPDEDAKLEEMFQKCLLLGGTCYSAHPRELSPQMSRLYDAYRPLIDRMRGRTFCFDPNPLTVPPDVDGNIFRGRGGEVFVPLVSRRWRALDGGGAIRDLAIRVRLPDAERFTAAASQATGAPEERSVALQRDGRELTLTIPEHLGATLVCVRPTDG